jgi:hypothetical protein
MDQRGFSLEPSETASPVAPSLPAARMRAWAELATHRTTVDLVPAQREHAAA